MANMSNYHSGRLSEGQIYNAILNHDINALRKAVKDGFNPEFVFVSRTPALLRSESLLQLAVRVNFLEGVEYLVVETGVYAVSAFREDCFGGNEELTRLFLKGAASKRRYSARYLYALASSRMLNLAREFIGMSGFNVEDQFFNLPDSQIWFQGRWGLSALHVAAFARDPELLLDVIKVGAYIDLPTEDKYTALFVACSLGSTECIHSLLAHGANPTNKGCVNAGLGVLYMSPLFGLSNHFASSFKEGEVVRLMLSAGLDMNKEVWLLQSSRKHKISSDTIQMLKSLCITPSNLQIACIRIVREQLSKAAAGKSIVSRAQGLPIPRGLQRKLVLCDV